MSDAVHPFLNRPAQEIEHWIRGAGQDPNFEEAESDLPELGYFSPFALGFTVTIGRDGQVDVIHIFSHTYQGWHAFEGILPEGLSFEMTRAELQNVLGNPAFSGGPVESLLEPNLLLVWDRWERDAYTLHCEFPVDENHILMVTLSRKDVAKA